MKHTMEHAITPGFLLRFTLPSIIMMIVLSMYTVVDGICNQYRVSAYECDCGTWNHVWNRYNGYGIPQAGRRRL